jgi:taurine transport system substrate-binding protein
MTTTTSAPTGPAAGPSAYQRRRRRRWSAAAGATVLVIAAIVAIAAASGGGSSAVPQLTIAYGQGTVANSDSILASQTSLAKAVPAHLKFVPFDAGVTAIAEMHGGSLQAISGVGNPPVVGGIATDGDVTVVLAQSFDADALIVPPSITRPSQLAGKSVGVLTGSSEDFELRGWLALQHLTNSVKVVGLASEQAVAAAYIAGSLTGAYVQAGPEAQLTTRGGHALTDARQIANQGIPGLNVVAVSTSLIAQHPDVVQKYVCAEVQATRDLTGPHAAKYLTESAAAQGVPGSLIVPATRAFPFIPLDQQLHWLGSSRGDANSAIVKAYVQTAQFLVGQGRIPSVPATSLLASHVDPAFIKKALSGGCSS